MARAIRIGRKLNGTAVIDVPTGLFRPHGVCLATFARTTVRNSSPRPCGTGLRRSPRDRRPANRGAPGIVEGRKTVRWTVFSEAGPWRERLLAGRIPRRDRGLAPPRQYRQAPLVAGLPPPPRRRPFTAAATADHPRLRHPPWYRDPSRTEIESGPPDRGRPEVVVNLMFSRLVRYETRFWRKVGRGTRPGKDLFGPGQPQSGFRIFDVCGNLKFFGSNPQLSTRSAPNSLTEKLIEASGVRPKTRSDDPARGRIIHLRHSA